MCKCMKRVTVLLLVLAMLFSTMGMAAAADPADQEEGPAVTEGTETGGDGEAQPGGDTQVTPGSVAPTYQQAYDSMIALKAKYPEGMTWTNFEPYGSKGNLGTEYRWKGGPVKNAQSGVGCAAFVFLLSDEAFGTLPSRTIDRGGFQFEDVKVGDILRVNGNSHFVIVLQKSAVGITVAEGNYNKSVHWGRAMSEAEVMTADFLVTRYPVNYVPADDAEANTVVQNGTEGSLSWTLTKAGVLTISGSGAIPDFSPEKLPSWNAHNDAITSIVIQDGITDIGAYAFYQSKALSVYIPDGVTSIGNAAFYKSDVIAATIPSSVQSVGNQAFYMCPNLASVTIPEGVKTIGDEAFRGCTTLAYVDFPASVTSIGAGAFMSCNMITQVRFKPGSEPVAVGDNLFSQCQHLSSVTLPKTMERVSTGMFQSCTGLRHIYIPGTVSSIGQMAFTSCTFLQADGIYFGGSEATWNSIGGNAALVTLKPLQVNVTFDVPYDDPFAKDPNDPGDLPTDPENPGNPDVPPVVDDPCKNGHTGTADANGNCTVCGKPMETPRPPKPDHGGSSGGSGSSGNTSTITKHPDGSVTTTTVDQKTGVKTESTKTVDGTVATVTTDADGDVTMDVKLPAAVTDGTQSNAIPLPLPKVEVSEDATAAVPITVRTDKDEAVKVTIPTATSTAGTVAVLVNPDGSTQVVKDSVSTKDGVVVSVENGAVVKVVDNSRSFADVTDESWAQDAIAFVSARELFSGMTATSFAPEAYMTRAMLMTVLARFDGAETSGGTTWYEKGTQWAIDHGVSDGANPNGDISREQLVTMLWRYLGAPAVDNGLSGYPDRDQISGYAQEAMRWAVENGIVSGLSDGSLNPQGQATRAQVAQMLKNLIEHMA